MMKLVESTAATAMRHLRVMKSIPAKLLVRDDNKGFNCLICIEQCKKNISRAGLSTNTTSRNVIGLPFSPPKVIPREPNNL